MVAFSKQFSSRPLCFTGAASNSLTVPGQSMTCRQFYERYRTGNFIGLYQVSDLDNYDYDESGSMINKPVSFYPNDVLNEAFVADQHLSSLYRENHDEYLKSLDDEKRKKIIDEYEKEKQSAGGGVS